MEKILVTGGAGFIGSNIVEALLRRGHEVRVLDNFSTGKRENIEPFLDDIELIEGDIRSYHIVREAIDDVDFVLHQAALPSIPRSIKDPITTNEVNVSGTLNVLDAAKDAEVRRVVYASSSSIYGDSEVLPKKENMTPNPLSPYSISKLAGEKYCQAFSKIYGLETVCLRYFNVFGPGQDPMSQYSAVIPIFIKAIFEDRALTIYGDGEQSRDFTYVDNVIMANILACSSQNTAGSVLNIAYGKRITLNEIVNILAKIFNKNLAVNYAEPRKGEIRHSLADISEARNKLGYSPSIGFEEGLNKTIAWYKSKYND